MKIRVGNEIASEFGRGNVVAITKEWIIHKTGDGSEVAIPIDDAEFWIPAEIDEFSQGGGVDFLDIKPNKKISTDE